MKTKLKSILAKIGNQFLRDSTRRQLDNSALVRLAPLLPEGFAWTQAAVAPRALSVLVNEIIIHRRSCVIECGSGISTMIMAKVLSERGGKIVSIDHDSDWQSIVREMCSGLDNVEFIHAPLRNKGEGQQYEWYDLAIVAEALEGQKFDMAFIDAPIAYNKPEARYPGYPELKKYLEASHAVFLDDTTRNGERNIARKWALDHDLNVQILDVVADMALLFPKTDTGRFVIT